jgi:PilZ domain-containing protein
MSDSLILPLAAALCDVDVDADAEARRRRPDARCEAGEPPVHRQRARRVGMVGAGYRAVIDGRHVALINLSLSGAQVRSSMRVLRDQPAIVKIGWPQDEQLSAAIARVRWVELEAEGSTDERIYRVGLAFETWDVRGLKEIMRHCGRTFGSSSEIVDPW